MKPWVKILISFLALCIAAALATPFLYELMPFFKFEKIFNRIVMVGTLLICVLFVRVRRETFVHYGLHPLGKQSLSYFFKGFLIAVVILSLLVGLKVVLGLASWSPMDVSWINLIMQSLFILAAALLIGVIEEFFFRGFIFQSLCEKVRIPLVLSVLITSIFYALLHFVSYRKMFIGDNPAWWEGFKLFLNPYLSLTALPAYWNEALGLFLLGIVLNIIVVRTKSLYAAIGLHAGCVFFVKMDGTFMHYMNSQVYWFSSDNMYDGLLGWIFLGIMGGILYGSLGKQKKEMAIGQYR